MDELTAAVAELTNTVNSLLKWAMDREASEQKREVERERWDTTWFVYSHEKGEVRYKSEAAAYEGGRYWREHSARPATVEVYCRETKSVDYGTKEFVSPDVWGQETPQDEDLSMESAVL